MRSMSDGKTSVDGEFFRQNGRCDFVQASAAVFFGNPAAHQSELAAFSNQLRHQARFFVFQILRERQNLFQNKFFRGLADELLIVSQVGGRKYILRSGGFKQKTSAFCRGFGNNAGGHEVPPEDEKNNSERVVKQNGV